MNVVDPLVGGLPDDGPDPEREVGGHQVHEAEPREHPELLHNHLGPFCWLKAVSSFHTIFDAKCFVRVVRTLGQILALGCVNSL